MRIFVLIAALFTASCEDPQKALHAVYAIDLSASIETRAVRAAFEAATGSLRSLRRGDRAAVIPILGDDLNEAQGRILRYEVGRDRKPYDSDLRTLAAEEKQTLRTLREAALRTPEAKTDVLGVVDLATEELGLTQSRDDHQALVILSDFLQDDTRFRFASDRALAEPAAAQAFAASLARGRQAPFAGVRVFLGALTSKDVARLSAKRREAIRAFWTTYLRELGAEVQWATDGSGMMDAFLANARTTPEAFAEIPDGPTARIAALAERLRFAW